MKSAVMIFALWAAACAGFGAVDSQGALHARVPPGIVHQARREAPVLVVQTNHSGHISDTKVAFSPDGTTLASVSSDNTIRLWDTHTGELKRVLSSDGDYLQHIAYSPDGRLLAAACWHDAATHEYTGRIMIWDAHTGLPRRAFGGAIAPVNVIAFNDITFSRDGKLLVSECRDGIVRIWNVIQRSVIRTLKLSGEVVSADQIEIASDGRTIAVVVDRELQIWDILKGVVVRRMVVNNESATALGFSPDSRTLAIGSTQGETRLWDLRTGEIRSLATGSGRVDTVDFSPDGAALLCGSYIRNISGYRVALWDIKTLRLRWSLSRPMTYVYSVAFSPNAETIAIAGSDEPGPGIETANILLLSAKTGQIERRMLCPQLEVHNMSFTADGAKLITQLYRHFSVIAQAPDVFPGSDVIGVWSTRTVTPGSLRMTPAPYDRTPSSFSSDGKRMVYADQFNSSIDIVNTGVDRKRISVSGSNYQWAAPAISPDGKTAAAAYGIRSPSSRSTRLDRAAIIDTATGEILRSLALRSYANTEFSPDGKTLATWAYWGPIELWDWRTGIRKRSLDIPRGNYGIIQVCFGPDSHTFAVVADYRIRIWDDRSPNGRGIVANAPDSMDSPWMIRAITFSPDGRTLAYADSLGHVTLLNIQTGRAIRVLHVGSSHPPSLAYSPTGKTLAVGGEDGRITWWDPQSGRLRLTCQLFPGPLIPKSYDRALPTDWIAYTPEGSYDGSPGVGRYIRWRVGDRLMAAEVYAARFHRPALVRQAIRER